MTEQNSLPVKYRHDVIAEYVADFRPAMTDANIKTMLEEFAIEWEAAKQATICEECGEPVLEGEPYAVDPEDGVSIGHAECIYGRGDGGEDRRDDSGYWKEDGL